MKAFPREKDRNLSMRGRYIITGRMGQGKTHAARQAWQALERKGLSCKAILSEVIYQDEERVAYQSIFQPGGEKHILCSRHAQPGWMHWKEWWFNPDTFIRGTQYLYQKNKRPEVILLDEIGVLELEGYGWASVMDQLIRFEQTLILTVRQAFVEEITGRWPGGWTVMEAHQETGNHLAEIIAGEHGRHHRSKD